MCVRRLGRRGSRRARGVVPKERPSATQRSTRRIRTHRPVNVAHRALHFAQPRPEIHERRAQAALEVGATRKPCHKVVAARAEPIFQSLHAEVLDVLLLQ